MNPSMSLLLFLLLHIPIYNKAAGEPQGTYTTFKFANKCSFTVWPGMLSNAGHSPLSTTGFELPTGTSRSIQAPPGWSGRLWGRTGCVFDSSGHGSCATGDCGAGKVECDGKGATPPATLAEFTLAVSEGNGMDFYDVSLVDGYNIPMVVASSGGEGGCEMTGCAVDLNPLCPMELRVGEGEACRSACEAFGRPEYCCSGDFGSPAACRPTVYSEMFKSACPRAYSYAYDDASSTFTCAGGDYSITFCPATTQSQKSTETSPSPPSEATGMVVEEDSWFASLAMGDTAANCARRKPSIISVAVTFSALVCVLLL